MPKRTANAFFCPTLSWLALCLVPALCLAAPPADFEARLDLARNGKVIGEMNFDLKSQDGRWIMASNTHGTHGLARFLALKESSTGEGTWEDSKPVPLSYVRDVQVIKHMHWSADFDWGAGKVHTVYPDGESTLDLKPGMVDESAIGLIVRDGLARGEDEWFLDMVDEDHIEHAHFRRRSVESIETPLGCMKVHVVEKVRGENSTRYTRTYYAEDHEFTPVKMEHGKTDGDHMEANVTELTVDGMKVDPGPGCGL